MTSVDRTRASGALRTGLSAGTAFAGGLSIGLVVAALALAAFVVYVPRLNGATGWWPWLLAALLLAMVPLDVFLGVHLGRGRAVARVVQRHGEGLAERMAQALAQRIEATQHIQQAMADFVQPTSLWLWLALGLDVLLFLAGLWLTA